MSDRPLIGSDDPGHGVGPTLGEDVGKAGEDAKAFETRPSSDAPEPAARKATPERRRLEAETARESEGGETAGDGR